MTAPFASGFTFTSSPFTLGIASGDITDSSAVLWTRLAPEPMQFDGGMAPLSFAVQWELASDPSLSHIIQRGESLATPALAHSVHVDIQGLEPGREYWYRFSVSGQTSAIGRTKTLPSMQGERCFNLVSPPLPVKTTVTGISSLTNIW